MQNVEDEWILGDCDENWKGQICWRGQNMVWKKKIFEKLTKFENWKIDKIGKIFGWDVTIFIQYDQFQNFFITNLQKKRK